MVQAPETERKGTAEEQLLHEMLHLRGFTVRLGARSRRRRQLIVRMNSEARVAMWYDSPIAVFGKYTMASGRMRGVPPN